MSLDWDLIWKMLQVVASIYNRIMYRPVRA